ncbi:L,D-transpeptidase family protein [Sphingomonas sp. MMS24-JH45]
MSVLVSIPDQRAYVFRGERMIGAATVSTGTDDRPTPTGAFTILQKAAAHRSNLYDDAPMPYMQRLTWDGVALHAGRNPGFPASHGCVRLPTAFAARLFAATELGATVEVTDGLCLRRGTGRTVRRAGLAQRGRDGGGEPHRRTRGDATGGRPRARGTISPFH